MGALARLADALAARRRARTDARCVDALAARHRAQAQRAGETGPAADAARVLHAMEQLCRALKRPRAMADIRAAMPATPDPPGRGALLTAADRLGFKGRVFKLTRPALAGVPTPCLLLGHWPGEAWLLDRRRGDHCVTR
jgi:hypothetical protein